MNSPAVEAFLVRLYVDAERRARFLADPMAVARAAGLSPDECVALAAIDREGLRAAGESYAAKQERHGVFKGWGVQAIIESLPEACRVGHQAA